MATVIALAGLSVTILWPEQKPLGWWLFFLAAVVLCAWLSFESMLRFGRSWKALVVSILLCVAVMGSLSYIRWKWGKTKVIESSAPASPYHVEFSINFMVSHPGNETPEGKVNPQKPPTVLFISGAVRNLGAPTTLGGCGVSLRFADGTTVPGQVLPPPEQDVVIPPILKGNPDIRLKVSQYWSNKNYDSQPVPSGGAATGWVEAYFSGYSQNDLSTLEPTFIWSCQTVDLHEFEADFLLHPRHGKIQELTRQ